MVGRLGSFEMSAAVLATTLYNVSGLSLLLGFASAMETFCGQAYGARNYKLVGVVLQRGMVSAGRRARQAAHQRDAMCVPIGPLVMVEQLQVPGVWCWSRQAAAAGSTRHAAHQAHHHTQVQILTTLLSACVAALWTQAEPLLLFFRQANRAPCRALAGSSSEAGRNQPLFMPGCPQPLATPSPLHGCRQDPLLSRSAARYILLLAPALLAQATFEVFKR